MTKEKAKDMLVKTGLTPGMLVPTITLLVYGGMAGDEVMIASGMQCSLMAGVGIAFAWQ